MPNIESTFGERVTRYWPAILATLIAIGGGISLWGGMLANQVKLEAQQYCEESQKDFLTYRALETEMAFRDRRLAMVESDLLRLREEVEKGVKRRIEELTLELKVHESSHMPPAHKRGNGNATAQRNLRRSAASGGE